MNIDILPRVSGGVSLWCVCVCVGGDGEVVSSFFLSGLKKKIFKSS